MLRKRMIWVKYAAARSVEEEMVNPMLDSIGEQSIKTAPNLHQMFFCGEIRV